MSANQGVPELRLNDSNPKDNFNQSNESESSHNLNPKEGDPPEKTTNNEREPLKERQDVRSGSVKRSTKRKLSEMSSKSGMKSGMFGTGKRAKWQKQIEHFLDSTPVIIFMSILTLYTLFFADIQAAWLRIEVDEASNIIQCLALVFFGSEFILNCVAKLDYFLGFFFWLDLIATVSLILDIDYIMDPIMGYGPTRATASKSTVQAAKAISKVSSAVRATRVLRVIRIVRLIRMVKLYKSVYLAREKAEKKKKEDRLKEMMQMQKEISGSNSNDTSRNESNISGDKSIKSIGTPKARRESASELAIETQATPAEQKKNGHMRNALLLKGVTSTPATTTTNIETNGKATDKKIHESTIGAIGKEKSVDKRKMFKRGNTRKNIGGEKKEDGEEELMDEEDEENLIKESKISKIVTESITKKVIVLILVLLIIFPLLSESFYSDDSTISYNLVANFIANDNQIYGTKTDILTRQQLETLFDWKYPPLNITVNGSYYYENKNYTTDYFRYKEVKQVYSDDGFILIQYSCLKETKLAGLLSLIQTLFVCLCLTLAAILFENDANTLVLEPLEIMIEIVDTVSKDPMNAKNVENLQGGIKATINKDDEQKESKSSDNYEVTVIKSAIIKISALLAIGFGEAGGEIIAKNLSSGQELNPRLKGKKKTAIFGFCDIRQFEEINLALEERTMLFVNEIAEIVHSSVDRFGGATNKNIGEAFLNVWKFYNETPVRSEDGKKQIMQRKDNLLEIDPSNIQVAITADMAVIAFLRVIMKINKNCNIIAYNKNPEILQRIPNFRLNMGFGLHMGYGIEGAVGSTYKIDASYLSPNVNIAARLESASRQFGVPLLVSGPLYNLCSDEMKNLMRFVDCVMVKGSVQPLELYTIDVNLNLKPQSEKKILIMSNKDKRKRFADKKEIFRREVEVTRSATAIILEKASYLELLHTNKTDEFYRNWEEGIIKYKEGDFMAAGQKFKECLKLDPTDGPAKTLLGYFEGRGYNSPVCWQGVRELTSK